MKSAADRDQISREAGVIAFEMESTGVWDEVPSIVVQGFLRLCRLPQTQGVWWNFAAATAASTTKAILERYMRTDKVVNTPDGDGEPIQTQISSTIADNRIVVGSQKTPVTAMPRANVGETPGHGPRLTEGWPTERPPNPSLNNFGPGDQFNVPRGTLNTSKEHRQWRNGPVKDNKCLRQ
ncbi:hypothetical protein MAJ_06462, partial [Metarhizium majus ARSEF 297]